MQLQTSQRAPCNSTQHSHEPKADDCRCIKSVLQPAWGGQPNLAGALIDAMC